MRNRRRGDFEIFPREAGAKSGETRMYTPAQKERRTDGKVHGGEERLTTRQK